MCAAEANKKTFKCSHVKHSQFLCAPINDEEHIVCSMDCSRSVLQYTQTVVHTLRLKTQQAQSCGQERCESLCLKHWLLCLPSQTCLICPYPLAFSGTDQVSGFSFLIVSQVFLGQWKAIFKVYIMQLCQQTFSNYHTVIHKAAMPFYFLILCIYGHGTRRG